MTPIEFRNSPYREQLAEILTNPVLRLALNVVKESEPPADPQLNADAIVSVRLLSRLTGFMTFAETLQELATPYKPPAEPQLEPTFEDQPLTDQDHAY